MKIEKKHVVAGAIMLVSITAGLLYLQYKKIMDWCINITRINLNSFKWEAADIDLYITVRNKSSVKVNLISQEYNVYINDKFVSKISNSTPQVLAPNSDSPLAIKMEFSPKNTFALLGMNVSDLLLHPENINIKITMSLKVSVKIGFLNVGGTIPFDYVTNLKEMTTSSNPNISGITCK